MATQRTFELPGLTLAAEVSGRAGDLPVLALHGWLDNAGSFDLLAPRLGGCELVAIDLAGHGLSSSRSADSGYNLTQDVGDVLEVADALGWKKFNLLGHSRGGAIAMLFAGTFPERVAKLALLDGGMPIVGEAPDAPANLADALLDRRKLLGKSGRVFTDRATAVRERAEGFSKVTIAASEILARRSLRAVQGGFQWHADQRLKGASELRLSEAHALAFVRRVTAPVLLLLADGGPFADRPIYRTGIEQFQTIQVETLHGGHHLHVEDGAADVAKRLRRFFELPA